MSVRKLKSSKWQGDHYYRTPQGALKRRRKSFETKKQAQSFSSAGTTKVRLDRRTFGPRMMKEAVQWYLASNKIITLESDTQNQYAHRLGQFLEWCELKGITFVTDYTQELAEARTTYLRGKYRLNGLAARLRLENAVLKAEMARRDTLLTWNPNSSVNRTVKTHTGNPDYLQREQIQWLLARASPKESAILNILLHGAFRPIELHEMEWSWISGDTVVIPFTKTFKARGVALDTKAMEAFEYFRSINGSERYVLLGDRAAHETYIQKVFSRMLKRITRKEPIPFDFWPYILRKSSASHALIGGGSIEDVAAHLGNTPGMIQKHYGALSVVNSRRIADLLENLDTSVVTEGQKRHI